MKKILVIGILLVILIAVTFWTANHFHWFGLGQPDLVQNTSSDVLVKPTTNFKYDPNCQEAALVPGSANSGRVVNNHDNGDAHSWSVTVINPDAVSGNQTLVVVTEPMWTFDIVHPVMYFVSARFDGTQEQVLCSANKLAEGTGELYVYAGSGEVVPEGYYAASRAVGPWWTEMTVWQYEQEAIDAGVAVEHFLGAQDENRQISAVGVALAHAQLWRPGYPGKVVHPQIAGGYVLTAPLGWQGTYWTYASPNEDIQVRIIEATQKEVAPRDQIGFIVLLYCGPADDLPATSFEFNGNTVSWVTSLDGWVCTAP